MLCGFSAEILKCFMEDADDITPYSIMMKAVNSYKIPKIDANIRLQNKLDMNNLSQAIQKFKKKHNA